MSSRAEEAVLRYSNVQGMPRFVLYRMANGADDLGRCLSPSKASLARDLLCPESTVFRAWQVLIKAHELRLERGGGGRIKSVWLITLVEKYVKTLKLGECVVHSQGVQGALPGSARRTPRECKAHPVPNMALAFPQNLDSRDIHTTSTGTEEKRGKSINEEEEMPFEFREFCARMHDSLNNLVATRIWNECKRAKPTVSLDEVCNAVRFKLYDSKGTTNLPGMLIKVVPKLLTSNMRFTYD